MKYDQKLFIAQPANLSRPPAMALNEFMQNCRFFTGLMPTGAFLSYQLVEEAFQQELSECRLSCFLRLESIAHPSKVVSAAFMIVCYTLTDLGPGRVIVLFWFCHVGFLLLVDGVATTTLSGDGVAFYFGGAS